MNENNTTDNKLPNLICGIDTLYYFYESNNNYDDFFIDLLDQLEDNKGRFEKREISYENNFKNKNQFMFILKIPD